MPIWVRHSRDWGADFQTESNLGMVKDEIRVGLVQLSCILSMIGSGLVVLTWAYPKRNRRKQGRILLMWLSLSDFLSSCVYFIQTFHPSGDDICEVNALLGIYFPVASFLWTDCIAFFLYLVVTNRNYQPLNWSQLLRNFHLFVWLISSLVIILVFAFGHAGYANDDDGNDGTVDNTGGWCWIKGDNPTERFVWEVIGGKFIEWVSCLIVLPYLYASVYMQLSSMENLQDTSMERTTLDTEDADQDHPRAKQQHRDHARVVTPSPIPKVRSIESLFDMSGLSQNDFVEQLSSQRASLATTEQGAPHTNSTTNTNNALHSQNDRQVSTDHYHSNTQGQGVSHNTQSNRRSSVAGGFFNKFYYKLAAVPIVLISIRVWSSIRIILQFARPHQDNADSFFEVMQAVFDPSQGIFNALLFVLASPEDRKSMFDAFELLFRRIKERAADCANLYCIGNVCTVCCSLCFCSACCTDKTPEDFKSQHSSDPDLRQRLISAGGTRSKADSSAASSTGHNSLLETSDYECDSSERMSDFSFDMTDSGLV